MAYPKIDGTTTIVQDDRNMGDKQKIVWVKCSFIMPVSVPCNSDYDEEFDIEENHCPATGRVGAQFDKIMNYLNKEGWCWACFLAGENKMVDEPINSQKTIEHLIKNDLI